MLIKKYVLWTIISIIILDVIFIMLHRMNSFNKSILCSLWFIGTSAISITNYTRGKLKLYRMLEEERKEILARYKFSGAFSTWIWNILKVPSNNKDVFLKRVKFNAILLELTVPLAILNFICVLIF